MQRNNSRPSYSQKASHWNRIIMEEIFQAGSWHEIECCMYAILRIRQMSKSLDNEAEILNKGEGNGTSDE